MYTQYMILCAAPYVYDTKREGHVSIEKLVYFDSYNGVNKSILSKLYDQDSQGRVLSTDLLLDFSFCHADRHSFFKDVLLTEYPMWYNKVPSRSDKDDNPCLQVLLWYVGKLCKFLNC